MEKFKGEYKTLSDKYEKWEDELRVRIERDVKEVIKRRCLALGVDCINTQHSFSTDLDYAEELSRKKIQQFHSFIIHVADYHKVELYFTVEKGVFSWIIEPL